MTLTRLCKNSEKSHQLKLVAGKDGLENVVRWIHIVEDVEVPAFLQGGELVFTTGIASRQSSWLLQFVENLKEHNAVGVVVNIGPYLTTIPPQVIVFCEQNQFPLFVIPWETRIIDVSYEFCRRIISDEKAQQTLSDAFKNLIVAPDNREQYATTLERSGFPSEANYTVVSLQVSEFSRYITGKFFKKHDRQLTKLFRLNGHPKGMFLWKKSLVLIYQNVATADVVSMLETAAHFAVGTVVLSAGISEEGHSLYEIGQLYKQSQWSLNRAKQSKKVAVSHGALGIYKILFNVENQEILRQYHQEVLGKLQEYDQANQTDYYDTLYQYCQCNGSVLELASKLNIHRNTVNNKVKKIKEILNVELNYETIMNCMLCLHMNNLINFMKSEEHYYG